MPYKASEYEKRVLEYWREHNTFEKSIEQRPEDKPYVFYDGPPFATGLPHYGHLVGSAMKDVVPRFWTMKGHRVKRKWGWDCHGLPIENLIEKDLNLGSKKEIEEYGIAKFNEACRDTVLKYADYWQKFIPRFGRWVDMENDYKTMDMTFMESVWWVFSELWKKGLIYEGKKPMHICPRCVTPLSNFEVTQGYKDIKDLSVIAKFKTTNGAERLGVNADVSILAWTTTPWTLPGNVMLAVGADITYVLVKHEEEFFVVGKELVERVFEGKEYSVEKEVKGNDLVGINYTPLFPYFAKVEGAENAFRVVAADFVSTEDGTGIVHIAPAFGTDDYEIFKQEGIPFVQHVNMDGTFTEDVTDFAGMNVKQKEDHMATDVEIIKWLAHNEKLFSKKKYEHSYPHCWRCGTPLLNYATSSWFVKVTALKDNLLENNKKINWNPSHVGEKRFGHWLENVRDWSISRNRFWGTPLPIWKSEDGDFICVSSAAELEKLTGEKVDDLHKHKIDHLVIHKDGKEYHRISEVLDTWFDSGSVPYAQKHYPFENKQEFEAGFPANYIAEGQDQTRGWFYTLHVLSAALTCGDEPSIKKECSGAFQNVIVNGTVRAEDGKKMSKSLKNYPDPSLMIDKYGADAVRYYLLSSPVVHAEDINFSETGLREMYNKVVNTLWNVFTFYKMFADEKTDDAPKEKHVLDMWILARMQELKKEVTENMESYKLAEATRPIMPFIADLSQWYVRRSRDRMKGADEVDKQSALHTLHNILLELSKVMAPFTPFIAETMYLELKGEKESVHLEDWPMVDKTLLDEDVLSSMEVVRKIVEMGLSMRKEAGIKVRQPLQSIALKDVELPDYYFGLLKDELNVKDVVTEKNSENWKEKTDGKMTVMLNIEITDELKKEGLVREIVRAVNNMRKEQGLTRHDVVLLEVSSKDAMLHDVITNYKDELLAATMAKDILSGGESEVKVDGVILNLSVKKV